MKKIKVCVITNILFISNICAQSSTIEIGKVMDYFQNQQYEEAINYLTPAAVSDSNNLSVLGFVAYAHLMNDDATIARKYYQRMLSVDSNNITAVQYLGLSSRTDPGLAMILLQRLINLQPSRAAHYKNMGDLLRRNNQKDSALTFYRRAYQLGPNDPKNVFGIAEILVDLLKFTEADSILETGLKKDSLNLSYLVLLIKSAYEAKDYVNAIVPGERLIRLGEIMPAPFSHLALSYYNLKMYNDCIRVCEYLINEGVQSESLYYYEAKSWAKLKDFQKSNELLNTCISIAIKETAELYYYNLGENNESTKQYKKAVTYYDSAYYLFKNPDMMYNAARIYDSNLQNEKIADNYYKKYLKSAKPKTADERKIFEYARTRVKKRPVK